MPSSFLGLRLKKRFGGTRGLAAVVVASAFPSAPGALTATIAVLDGPEPSLNAGTPEVEAAAPMLDVNEG